MNDRARTRQSSGVNPNASQALTKAGQSEVVRALSVRCLFSAFPDAPTSLISALAGCFFSRAWNAKKHPNLINADAAPPGHGVVLWFQVDDFDAAVERVRRLKGEIIEDVHFNPAPQHREIWLRDPDGYVVVIASPDGESGS